MAQRLRGMGCTAADLSASLLIFLKGMLMGIADIIPGVSGGTLALITGIYERLVQGIAQVSSMLVQLPSLVRQKKLMSALLSLDFALFVPLGLGIGLALYGGSLFFSVLLTLYPALVYSFFIGLIVASAVLLFMHSKKSSWSLVLFGILGGGLGAGIVLIPVLQTASVPSFLSLFFLGMVALCAMILPGISGSYILLIFGQLSFMYSAVANVWTMWPSLLIFGSGGVVGLLFFSRLLTFLLARYKHAMLYFLAGLMLGALLSPLQVLLSHLHQESLLFSLCLFGLGIGCIVILHRFGLDA